jgi:hypothetical protein
MSDGSAFYCGPYGSTNGNKFLTITTTGGELLKSVTVVSVVGFGDLWQPRAFLRVAARQRCAPDCRSIAAQTYTVTSDI